MEYVRKLNPTEMDRHYVYIDATHRNLFPATGISFKIKIDEHEINAKVDKFSRIYISKRVKGILKIKENSVLVFRKQPNGTYLLSSQK